ncbi:abortive infection family protein [Radiobacillus sp. PE A8.2]|uniref:abortive infection family protein n=1 Tax=Radiobacillus sp. PE A8.2 TaxID=3380349 RepID=UPI00388DB6AD
MNLEFGGFIMQGAPLTDEIAISLSQLIDDSQATNRRDPSHSDLDFIVQKAELWIVDPKNEGRNVGKAKRLRAVLYWALENDIKKGEKLVKSVISIVKASGGFRKDSINYTGQEQIENLMQAFKSTGYGLTLNGEIQPVILDNLSEKEMSEALHNYIRRAKQGVEDAALVAGTGKDLMEAVAAHVILKKMGSYPSQANFPTLLGQAFMMVGVATSYYKKDSSNPEPATHRFEKSLYELACSINKLRNKERTGHGRPFLSNLSQEESISAIESIGVVAEYLLNKLELNIKTT